MGIEEVAKLNGLALYQTFRPGEFKAHCPVCKDQGRSYHLYVTSDKNAFYCHKCGSRGGVVAFHAWLKGIDFVTARDELYPSSPTRPRRMSHPAEKLTSEELAKIGFTARRLPRKAPSGIKSKRWRAYRQETLNWIWREWCDYQKFQQEQSERIMRLLAKPEHSHAV